MSQALLASPLGYVYLNVTDYKLGLSSLLDSGQLLNGTVYYPIKALQDDFTFSVQYTSRADLLTAQNFILSHFKKITDSNPTEMIMRFYWPQLNLDYAGMMTQFSMGIKKFEYAPKRQYTMQLVRDSIYTVTGSFSSSVSWTSIYGNGTVSTSQDNPWLLPTAGTPAPTPPPPNTGTVNSQVPGG
jgi:hypothetical protein